MGLYSIAYAVLHVDFGMLGNKIVHDYSTSAVDMLGL
jgi:hypothetical protein